MIQVSSIVLSVVTALFIGIISGQSTRPDDRVQLLALEHRWAQAAVKGDADGMAQLMADDYVEITMVTDTAANKTKWKNTGKTQWVQLVRSGHEKYESVDLNNLRVYFHSDVATVTGEYRQTGTHDGTDISAAGLYVDTWVRKDGQWKVVSSVFP
jgi:ketosteroid isomerase-like protein